MIYWVLSLVATAFLLFLLGNMMDMENAEFLNCLIAVFIYRVLYSITFLVLPFRAIASFSFFLGAGIILGISTVVIAKVLDTSYGKAFGAALLIFIISVMVPCIR